MDRVLIVHNPLAGPLASQGALESIRQYLEERRVKSDCLQVPYTREDLHARLKNKVDRILVAGGDGTLNRVVQDLMPLEKVPPLAVFPLGTANDFARGLGIETVPAALEKVFSGEEFRVDVGNLSGRHFINVAAGGFLCEVAHGTDQRLKKTLGRLAYYLKGLLELSTVKPVELGVAVEGREVFAGRAFLFLILNSPGTGHFSNLAPDASLSDGRMDLMILKECTGPELMGVLFKALSGRHTRDPHILLTSGETFQVEGSPRIVTDLDGEEGPPLPWQAEVLPQRLPFLR